MNQYFNDPDSNALIYDFVDDQTDPSDDNHPYLIDIDSQGIARYDPALKQNNEDINSWTIENVRFIVRDGFDESAVSREVTFFVRAVKFDVQRVNPGESVSTSTVAEFTGQGLPGAKVEAMTATTDFPIKSVIVDENGTWLMEINLQDLDDISREIKFEMNGQTFGGSSEPASFNVAVGDADEGMNLLLIVAIVIGALILLGGVGYFFIEFEELEDEEFDATQEVEQGVDPYAWGKKDVVAIPQQPVAPAAVQQPAAPQQSAQHPGWMWDQETNQWVPDPNYQPPGQ